MKKSPKPCRSLSWKNINKRLRSVGGMVWGRGGGNPARSTLLTSIVGWLTATEILPLRQGIQYSDAERNFLRIRLGLAIVIGVIVPAIAWFVWREQLAYHHILGFYLAALVIQIVTEQVFSSLALARPSLWLIGFPSLVVTIYLV
jgi:hypothetical protein